MCVGGGGWGGGRGGRGAEGGGGGYSKREDKKCGLKY